MRTIVNAVIVYWILLLALRLVGRRSPNMMTPFEMILIFLLGGISMQSIVGEDRSLTNAILGVSTISLMHVLVANLKIRFPRFAMVVDGTPASFSAKGNGSRTRCSVTSCRKKTSWLPRGSRGSNDWSRSSMQWSNERELSRSSRWTVRADG